MKVDKSKELQQVSETIQHHLFYESVHIELIVSLCKDAKPHSVRYHCTLVKTIHRLLSMMEQYAKDKNGLVMRKKVKVSNRVAEEEEAQLKQKKYKERVLEFSFIEQVIFFVKF